jgi:hypothetical protein
MGQAQPPISPTTQQLYLTVADTTDGQGRGEWLFSNPPLGSTWTGTITISGGISNGRFDVFVGGILWGTFQGGAIFGPVQISGQGSQQLKVIGYELNINTTYTMTLIGSSDQELNTQPIYPEPTASTSSVVFGNSGYQISPNQLPTNFLPAMAVGDYVVISADQSLGRNYSSFGCLIVAALSHARVRQFLVTVNGVSAVSPYQAGSLRGTNTGPYVPNDQPSWNLKIPVTASYLDAVIIQLIGGTAVNANELYVDLRGYTAPETQQITNPPSTPLGVHLYGGVQKYVSTGAVANIRKPGPTIPSWGGSDIDDTQLALKLHSVSWISNNTGIFTMYDETCGGIPFFNTVSAANGAFKYANFNGLVFSSNGTFPSLIPITWDLSVTSALMTVLFAYDIVAIPYLGTPY